MMPSPIIKPDPATLAAAEALAALGVGDTALARQKYAEAGAIIEQEMKVRHGGSEKQFLRFLAATQYYKGGDYLKAQELAKKIDARVLPKNVRGLLPQFLKDVKLRASAGYEMGMRQTLRNLWLAQKPREAIAILQNHPYVVDAAGLAFMRATLCERLGEYRAAALFFSSVIRYAPGGLAFIFMPAACPLTLQSQGRVAEAWEYVQHQLVALSHPVTYVTASIVSYHRASTATSEERRKRFEEQLAFIEQAWDAYQKLPQDQRTHPDMRAYMAFGLEAAATTWLRLGNKQRSQEVWDQAVKLGANPASPWATLAFATGPSEQASQVADAAYLSELTRQFSKRFTDELSIRQHLIGA